MKLSLVASVFSIGLVTSFTRPYIRSKAPATLELEATSRRDILTALVGGIAVTSLPSMVTAAPQIDYDKVTDLLGQPQQQTEYIPGGKRPTYLAEPTQEFKENEVKAR